jgi:hypothetical protein
LQLATEEKTQVTMSAKQPGPLLWSFASGLCLLTSRANSRPIAKDCKRGPFYLRFFSDTPVASNPLLILSKPISNYPHKHNPLTSLCAHAIPPAARPAGRPAYFAEPNQRNAFQVDWRTPNCLANLRPALLTPSRVDVLRCTICELVTYH